MLAVDTSYVGRVCQGCIFVCCVLYMAAMLMCVLCALCCVYVLCLLVAVESYVLHHF